MSQLLGYISLNTDNIPNWVDTTSHIRVRIPQFHGDPSIEGRTNYTADSNLPWARVVKPITAGNDFIAADCFVEGELVLVEVLDNDRANLTILGKYSNYAFTSDSDEIAARKAGLSSGYTGSQVTGSTDTSMSVSQSVVKTALSQVTNPPITDSGCNKVKYNAWYYTDDENATTYTQADWCCAFVCWVFNKSNCKEYFYGGNKTASCVTLFNYHKSIGEQTDKNYKAGDILFMNFKGGSNITHVEIAVSDFNTDTQTIDCVGGNVYIDDTQNGVAKNTRNASQILYGIRPGTGTGTNRSDPGWKQKDPRWKNTIMKTKTIGNVGCLMTSVSILLKMTGLVNSTFSPAVLNDYLRNNGGYVNGNCFVWAKTDGYVSGWKYTGSGSLTGSNSQKTNKIKKLLLDGKYVVIGVKNNGHYVAATGYTADNIKISDPGYSVSELFNNGKYSNSSVVSYYTFTCTNPFKLG